MRQTKLQIPRDRHFSAAAGRLLGAALALLVAGGVSCVPKPKAPEPERPRAAKVLPPLSEAQKKEAYALYQKGEAAYKEGRFAEGIDLFLQLLQHYPQSTLADDGLFWIGRIQFEQGATERSVQSLQRLLSDYPDSDLIDEARFWLGRAYVVQGRTDDAITMLEDLLGTGATSERAGQIALLLGDAYAQKNQLERSVRWFVTARTGMGEETGAGKAIRERIEKMILSSESLEDIESLTSRYKSEFPGDVALYRQMEMHTSGDSLSAAQKDGETFLSRFSDHPFSDRVKAMLRMIEGARQVNPLKIGVLLPLSGRFAVFGERAMRGIELAAQRFDEGKNPVTLAVRDTAGDPEQAVRAVEELAFDEHVVAIVGPLLGITAGPAAERAQILGIPLIALSQRDGLPEIGPYVFRYFMTAQDQVRAVVTHAIQARGLRTFGILYPENALGRDFLWRFWKEVESQGGWVVAADSYEPNATDFKVPLSRMTGRYYPDARSYEEKVRETLAGSDWKPDAVEHIEYSFWYNYYGYKLLEEGIPLAKLKDHPQHPMPAWPPEEGEMPPRVAFDAIFVPDGFDRVTLIAPQLDYNDILGVDLLGIAAWDNPKLSEQGDRYVEGSVFVDGFFADSQDPATRDFVARYQEVFNDKPTLLEATAYDAATLVHDLVRTRKPKLRSELRTALLAVKDMPLLLGKISMDASGEARIPLTLLTVANRRISELRLSKTTAPGEAAPSAEAP